MTTAEVDAVDFEPEDDDLLDDDVPMEEIMDAAPAAPAPKLRSTIITSAVGGGASQLASAAGAGAAMGRKTKGRGFREENDVDRSNRYAAKEFESLDSEGGPGPQRCILSISYSILLLLFKLPYSHDWNPLECHQPFINHLILSLIHGNYPPYNVVNNVLNLFMRTIHRTRVA